MARREVPTIQVRDRDRNSSMFCIRSSTHTTSESYGFYYRRRKSPAGLATPCLPHSTRQSELHKGTRCRRYSSCTSKQPFGRCADVFHVDHNLPSEEIYVDDVDFISTYHETMCKVNEVTPTPLGDWFLYVNVGKTERTIISCETDSVAEQSRTTKKPARRR